ncbi:MAG: MFS transporter [Halobacteriaceae archaeon]
MSDPPADGEPARTGSSIWRNPNFRRFFVGQFVTNVGDSLYGVAIMWLVYQLTGSPFLTGVANGMLLLPWLLQIAAGPIVDRLRLGRLLVGTQVAQGVIVLAVPIAVALDALSVGLLLAIIPALAVVTTLAAPIRTALVPRILREEQLSDGNAALSTVTLGLDMLFDAAGGLLIAALGATTLFVADSVTFGVAAMLFLAMTIPPADPGDGPSDSDDDGDPGLWATLTTSYLADLREGVAVLRGSLFVELVALSAVFSLGVGVTLALLPVYADQLGGPAQYGFLLGALGTGRLVGSILGSRLDGLPYGRLVAGAYIVAAGCWVAALAVPSPALTVVLFGLAWIPPGFNGVLTSTLNQRVFPPELLGRISSAKGTASTATLPLGSLLGGILGTQVSAGLALAIGAGGLAVTGGYVLVRRPLRRLPPVGEASAADLRVDLTAHEREDR